MKPDHLFFLFIVCGLWVMFDGWRRGDVWLGVIYGLCSMLLAPFIIPFYLAHRPLRAGEIREGGVAWNVLKNFAVLWTLVMLYGTVDYCATVGKMTGQLETSAERAGAGIGMLLALGMLGAVWFFPLLGALVFGLLLKKSSVIEKGPTGPLAE